MSEFNIAFGTPRTDVCSRCAELEEKSKIEGDVGLQAELELGLHKIEAKNFNTIHKHDCEKCDIFTVCFDLQQNLPFPKTNIGEIFYKRQLWFYNLGIVSTSLPETPENINLFNWLECDSGRGCNEIISALKSYLEKLTTDDFRRKGFTTLSLFSDSCPGQNKNYPMIMFLLLYVNSDECPFKNITFTFPTRGHSYMSPDRVFGRIEKDIRKRETILLPAEYRSILSKHGTIHKLGPDWRIFDYKSLSQTSIKKNIMPVRNLKRWLFKKDKKYAWVSETYNGDYTRYSILQKNVLNIKGLKPRIVPYKSHVKAAKKKDVRLILQLLHCSDTVKQYYEIALR